MFMWVDASPQGRSLHTYLRTDSTYLHMHLRCVQWLGKPAAGSLFG